MKEKIEKWLKESTKTRNKLVRELRDWVLDESIPLDERWDLFIYSKLGDTGGYIEHYDVLDNLIVFRNSHTVSFEDMIYASYAERFQEITVGDLYQWLVDYKADESDPDDPETFQIEDEHLNAFKREALQKFIYSFILDW